VSIPEKDRLKIPLIPYPDIVQHLEGTWDLDSEIAILAGPGTSRTGEMLNSFLFQEFGLRIPIETSVDPQKGAVVLKLESRNQLSSEEGYSLDVNVKGVVITASGVTGLFYGVRTFQQLLRYWADTNSSPGSSVIRVPSVSIQDVPRFRWRGLMLDCSRTFQSPDYLRRTIDWMSYYKLNVLHLHLTDDQGWRIEIERYPELTLKGSRFAERFQEPEYTQGFYSQEELHHLVEYASERGITVVPEIEMPGHSLAVLTCYPDLSCRGGSFEIYPFFQGPNITTDILCAGNDRTFEFLTNVLEEVLEIFPSEYIHVGGDEVPKTAWEKCLKCQARMKQQGLKNEEELQGWFIQEIGSWLRNRNRKLIGWDEILEGDVGPDAAVMSWRGIEGGIEGAASGHAIVMSPVSHCYLDFSPVQIPLKEMYLYEPIPDALTAEQRRLVLGLQGNFWSHIDRIPARVDAMIYPRLLAIAERAWSPADCRDWQDFSRRLQFHQDLLTKKGVVLWDPPVAEWSGRELASAGRRLSIDVSDKVRSKGRYSVFFRKKAWEDTKLKVSEVSLLADRLPVATDRHAGVIGWDWALPDYFLDLKEYDPKKEFRLTIQVEGTGREGGGEIYFGPVR